ncbi:unnamed protein product [Pedinophyceae sp. YPF-701]|nr:unnamed protein product [Pedinophyceae sp. YPF-701]
MSYYQCPALAVAKSIPQAPSDAKRAERANGLRHMLPSDTSIDELDMPTILECLTVGLEACTGSDARACVAQAILAVVTGAGDVGRRRDLAHAAGVIVALKKTLLNVYASQQREPVQHLAAALEAVLGDGGAARERRDFAARPEASGGAGVLCCLVMALQDPSRRGPEAIAALSRVADCILRDGVDVDTSCLEATACAVAELLLGDDSDSLRCAVSKAGMSRVLALALVHARSVPARASLGRTIALMLGPGGTVEARREAARTGGIAAALAQALSSAHDNVEVVALAHAVTAFCSGEDGSKRRDAVADGGAMKALADALAAANRDAELVEVRKAIVQAVAAVMQEPGEFRRRKAYAAEVLLPIKDALLLDAPMDGAPSSFMLTSFGGISAGDDGDANETNNSVDNVRGSDDAHVVRAATSERVAGNTDNFAALIQAAGDVVLAYTNRTTWDEGCSQLWEELARVLARALPCAVGTVQRELLSVIKGLVDDGVGAERRRQLVAHEYMMEALAASIEDAARGPPGAMDVPLTALQLIVTGDDDAAGARRDLAARHVIGSFAVALRAATGVDVDARDAALCLVAGTAGALLGDGGDVELRKHAFMDYAASALCEAVREACGEETRTVLVNLAATALVSDDGEENARDRMAAAHQAGLTRTLIDCLRDSANTDGLREALATALTALLAGSGERKDAATADGLTETLLAAMSASQGDDTRVALGVALCSVLVGSGRGDRGLESRRVRAVGAAGAHVEMLTTALQGASGDPLQLVAAEALARLAGGDDHSALGNCEAVFQALAEALRAARGQLSDDTERAGSKLEVLAWASCNLMRGAHADSRKEAALTTGLPRVLMSTLKASLNIDGSDLSAAQNALGFALGCFLVGGSKESSLTREAHIKVDPRDSSVSRDYVDVVNAAARNLDGLRFARNALTKGLQERVAMKTNKAAKAWASRQQQRNASGAWWGKNVVNSAGKHVRVATVGFACAVAAGFVQAVCGGNRSPPKQPVPVQPEEPEEPVEPEPIKPGEPIQHARSRLWPL